MTEKHGQYKVSAKPKYFSLSDSDTLKAVNTDLSKTACGLWIYLSSNGFLEDISVEEPLYVQIAVRLKVSRQTVNGAFSELHTAGILPQWITFRGKASAFVERQIRDRLKNELNGQIEVITDISRIDRITASEVIEIKNLDDWKEALGKILAYAAFFLEHNLRIHLFGRADLSKLAAAKATCSQFDIAVTFEEVQP